MEIAADLNLLRAERDALAFLGLLSSLYLRFDPPISCGDGDTAQPTHFQGLNIHALIIDNADGEVLALEHNQIHAHQSPVEHAEQRALRMAIARIGAKRPRAPATTVEDYYRAQMFYDDGPGPWERSRTEHPWTASCSPSSPTKTNHRASVPLSY